MRVWHRSLVGKKITMCLSTIVSDRFERYWLSVFLNNDDWFSWCQCVWFLLKSQQWVPCCRFSWMWYNLISAGLLIFSKNTVYKELIILLEYDFFPRNRMINVEFCQQLKLKSFGDLECFHTRRLFYTFIGHIKVYFC